MHATESVDYVVVLAGEVWLSWKMGRSANAKRATPWSQKRDQARLAN